MVSGSLMMCWPIWLTGGYHHSSFGYLCALAAGGTQKFQQARQLSALVIANFFFWDLEETWHQEEPRAKRNSLIKEFYLLFGKL